MAGSTGTNDACKELDGDGDDDDDEDDNDADVIDGVDVHARTLLFKDADDDDDDDDDEGDDSEKNGDDLIIKPSPLRNPTLPRR